MTVEYGNTAVVTSQQEFEQAARAYLSANERWVDAVGQKQAADQLFASTQEERQRAHERMQKAVEAVWQDAEEGAAPQLNMSEAVRTAQAGVFARIPATDVDASPPRGTVFGGY